MWRGKLGECCFVGSILSRGKKEKGARNAFEESGASIAWFALGGVSSV